MESFYHSFSWTQNQKVVFIKLTIRKSVLKHFKIWSKKVDKMNAYRVQQIRLCSYQIFGFISVVTISKKLTEDLVTISKKGIFAREISLEKTRIFVNIGNFLKATAKSDCLQSSWPKIQHPWLISRVTLKWTKVEIQQQ